MQRSVDDSNIKCLNERGTKQFTIRIKHKLFHWTIKYLQINVMKKIPSENTIQNQTRLVFSAVCFSSNRSIHWSNSMVSTVAFVDSVQYTCSSKQKRKKQISNVTLKENKKITLKSIGFKPCKIYLHEFSDNQTNRLIWFSFDRKIFVMFGTYIDSFRFYYHFPALPFVNCNTARIVAVLCIASDWMRYSKELNLAGFPSLAPIAADN